MHLKRLKVRNFKSFAGAAEIPFEPGFTGVAGPNGMGKSNISDAILFVLGPTSSKALRADRLTHLLFNGGASKKAATDCEVSIVFDNRDRLLPVESDEVEVTRYVKLAPSDPDGYYSYFYINGRRSTQTEIDSLLAHARLSGDGYNLVQQGDVNKIVAMGPIPRRGLVERLAGISQYDDELARAEAKRTELEANLGRIGTLLTEVRSHLTALESQRLQAIQYRQLQDERRHAEARLARAGHRLAAQEMTSGEAQVRKLGQEIEQLRTELGRWTAEQERLTQAIGEAEREIARRGGAEAEQFKADLDQRRLNFARVEETVRASGEALEELGARIQELHTQLKSDEKERGGLEKVQKTAEAALALAERQVADSTAALRSTTGDAEQSQGKLAGTRKEIVVLQRQQTEREAAWQTAVQRQGEAQSAVDSAEREVATAEDDHRTRELELKDLELRARPSKGERGAQTPTKELQDQLFKVRAKEKAAVGDAQRLTQELQEANRQYAALDARIKSRTEGGRGASALAAVDFLLSQRNLGRIEGIRGTVEELARFDPEHQTALQVAAGARFQGLVVETDLVAEECIKLLRAEKRGRATFLPLNKMLPGRPHGKSLVAAQASGAVGFALDLVKFDEELRPAFWYVFGETVVMKDLASARAQIGGVRLATLTGDLIEATGAITGGYLEAGGRGADSAVQLKRLGEELREKSAAQAAAQADSVRLGDEVRRLAEELAKRSGEAQAAQGAQELIDQEMTGARGRLAEATKRVQSAHAALKTAEAALERARAQAATLQGELDAGKSTLVKLQEEFYGHLPSALSSKLRTLQEAAQTNAEAKVTATRELEAARGAVSAADSQLEARRTELAALEAQRKEKQAARADAEKGLAAAREALDALRAVEAQQSKAVQAQSEKRRQLEAERLGVVEKAARGQEAVRQRDTMLQTEQVRLAQARQHLAEVEAALKELPPPEADEKPVPAEELKRTITTLTAQLESMGSVNLRALEEYDGEKARLEEFEGEVARLNTERTELNALVGEVEKKKREKLVTVVTAVNGHYQEIYRELSGGGSGEILLENPADPLAGGLLIQALPIGKTVNRLEQLSGGEKSLASLAFIFALQRHDPSPLYVFDEVDMSLDGVNAENVGRMLRRNAERAQFIVISLRKVTLKFAHRLFGVTMHGDGRSRVVGLRIDEVVDVDEQKREPATGLVAPGAA